MTIKCITHKTYDIERYPTKCKECPFFQRYVYKDMNATMTQRYCELGYMPSQMDGIYYKGNVRYPKCRIEENENVRIMNNED